MVKYRSEILRSRTGIHGGVRRGSAAAAIGAVLVLTAGVPASQADGGSGSEDPDVQVTGSAELPGVGGLLQGLLGDAATAPTSPQPTPVPEATTASPTPVPTATAPATTAPATAVPAPTTLSPSPIAATGTATPVPATSALGSTAAAAPLQEGTAPGAVSGLTGSSGMDTDAADEPAAAAGGDASARALPAAGAPGLTATSSTGVPQGVGGAAESRHEMTAQTEPAAEAAKVWLGVGLVGSAGAAGLVFTRIRRI
ncbi:MAG TPA: hypothetical protein VJ617_19370 [Arthrobacter sp.]|nr:hypothetical protein [Arthrobacter sp.]